VNRLRLLDSAGTMLLVFTRRQKAAVNPAQLHGTSWLLQSVDSTAAQDSMTLALDSGTAKGFAGCRNYTATYIARDDELHFTSISMTDTECKLGDSVQKREGDFTTYLSEATHYNLISDTLVITTASGRRVKFLRR
jgi:heat shock protein HslJ